jgi:two-component system chemotaxis response regulator CheY
MEKRILVVDDAMFMRVQLKNILSQAGYAVSEAANGEEAVRMTSQVNPDLTVMDLTMPVMDGLTAIKQIISEDPGAKIIVCSAMGQSNMVLEAVTAGAKDFIVKPFQAPRVLASVLQQLGG